MAFTERREKMDELKKTIIEKANICISKINNESTENTDGTVARTVVTLCNAIELICDIQKRNA